MGFKMSKLLSTVSASAFRMAGAQGSAITAIQAAKGEELNAVRAAFVAGWIAYRLNPAAKAVTAAMLSKAAAVLAAQGFKVGVVANGKPRRNEEEEKAYAAARQAWSGALAKAGIASNEKRGGARKAGPERKAAAPVKAAAPQAAPIAKPQAAPTIKAPDAAREFIEQQAVMLMHFEKKNAARLPAGYKAAVEAFAAAIAMARHAAKD